MTTPTPQSPERTRALGREQVREQVVVAEVRRVENPFIDAG